jgi:uncharacterized ferritin-like protein (DUF455 family)
MGVGFGFVGAKCNGLKVKTAPATLHLMVAADAERPDGTAQAWALRYIATTELAHKIAPGAPPRVFAAASTPARLITPGRPRELDVVRKSKRTVKRGQLRSPRWRAHLLHTFWHHELQAAELMCWALLAFPAAPLPFRRGLLQLCVDEIRHMGLYQQQIERLGHRLGDFPVRDWFWQRVTMCSSPAQFVALLGLGLEGGNLDHADRFAAWFAAAGDHEAANTQTRVGREEIVHVRFAARWFRHFTGGIEYARWVQELPAPLSPRLLRGLPLNRTARARAGLPAAFLDALAQS